MKPLQSHFKAIPLKPVLAAVFTYYALLGMPTFACAQNTVSTTHSSASTIPSNLAQIKETSQLTIMVHQGQMIRLPRPATQILVADPKIASFQVPSPNNLFVYAENVGNTSLYALDSNNQVIAAIKINTEYDLSTLTEQIKQEVPGANIHIEPSVNKGLIVKGTVKTPIQARQVIDSAQAYLESVNSSSSAPISTNAGGNGGNGNGKSAVINQLKVETSSQINIQVRVVEMSRTMSNQLGFDWSAVLSTSRGMTGLATSSFTDLFQSSSIAANSLTGATSAIGSAVPSGGGLALGGMRTRGNFTLGALLTAMQSEGMASVLAEPNLTAMSGETAAFAAGGEVPIVLITANNISIDYKSYGVILRMTPTLLSANRVSLHIAPEVSELTTEGSVTLSTGSVIPALTIRRADTTVELASGQSFALAGMLRSNKGQSVTGIPGLRNIPLLGRLFETQTENHTETELVILVTAYVVDPVSPSDLQVPGQGTSDVDSLIPKQAAAGYLY